MDRFLAKLGKGERSCLALFPGFISVCHVQYEIQHNQVMTVAEVREHGYRSRVAEPHCYRCYLANRLYLFVECLLTYW